MDFQNRSQNLEASLERHRSVSRACFDQRHEFKKDLPRIDFGPVQRGGYLITGLGTLLNAPVFSASGASAAGCRGSRLTHLLRPTPTVPLLWIYRPTNLIHYRRVPSWTQTPGSICFRPCMRHFLTPVTSSPKEHLSILGTKIG